MNLVEFVKGMELARDKYRECVDDATTTYRETTRVLTAEFVGDVNDLNIVHEKSVGRTV